MRRTTEKQVSKTFGVVGEIVDHLIDVRGHDNPLCLFVCSSEAVYEFFNRKEHNVPYIQVLLADELKHVQQSTCGREYSNIFFIGDVDKDVERYVLSRHRRPKYTGPKTVTWFGDIELENLGATK